LITYVDFNNGHTLKSSISCGLSSDPYGLWVDRSNNEFGVSFLTEDYYRKKSKNSFIQYFNENEIGVNFMGMTSSAINTVTEQLEEFNIDVTYNRLEFDKEGILDAIEFHVNFNNHLPSNRSFSCSPCKKPFGLWTNRSNGNSGVGFMTAILNDHEANKQNLIKSMTEDHARGAIFHLGSKEVEFDVALEWVKETNFWQSTRELTNENNLSYTLESSIDYNPFN